MKIQKIAAFVAVLASLSAIFGLMASPYSSYTISDINSIYSNPTKLPPMSDHYEQCLDKVFRAQMDALRKGADSSAAAREAKAECKPVPKTDNARWETTLSFTNKGQDSMNDISILYLALDSEGRKKDTVSLARTILASNERFHKTGIGVSEPIAKALICIQYSSGPLRKTWKAYSGKPADSVTAIMDGHYGRFELRAEGTTWFFGSDCGDDLEKLLAQG